jgi:hypothetical protein
MLPNEHEKWLAEFREGGPEKVRRDIMAARWPKEKRTAARVWLEREDNKRWQAERGSGDGKPVRKNRQWMMYVIGGIGVAFAAVRAFRMLRHGF